MQLVQEGKLQTSDTIDKFFPEFSHGSKITIDNLLHMDSGIPDFQNESLKFFKGRTAEEKEAFMNGQMSDETMLKYLYKTELIFEVCSMKNTTCTETGNITSEPQGNAEYMPVAGWLSGMVIFTIPEVLGAIVRLTMFIRQMEKIFT